MNVDVLLNKIQELVYDGSQDMLRSFLQEGDMGRQDYAQLSTQVNELLWDLSRKRSIHEIFNMVEDGKMVIIGYESIDDLMSHLV